MEKKYFKKQFKSTSHERTIYGYYDESNFKRKGYIFCPVHDIDSYLYTEHIRHLTYKDHFYIDKITHITEKEYTEVINKLHEADDYYCKADEILKALI